MRPFLLTGLRRQKMHKSLALIKIPKGSRSGKIAIGTARRAIRANKMGNNALFEAVWGGKSEKLDRKCLKLFFENVLPTAARSTFLKNMMRKVRWNIKIMKVVSCSLHFWHKFTSMSGAHKFFAPRSALASVFWKSQNQPDDGFRSAGRNARGRWGRFWGG